MENIAGILQICGVLFVLKTSVYWIGQIYQGIRTYILPRIFDTQGNFKTRFGQWALVTGCTGGIGKEFALALAKKGLNIVLVSRSKIKLDLLAREIQQEYGVLTLVIVADFTRLEDLPMIAKDMREAQLDLGILVNNVGITSENVVPFLDHDQDEIINMINVNCSAATFLCHAFLPSMKVKGRGAIINVSSLASCSFFPMMTVYSGTKHYIHAFTKALAMETTGSGVIIQELVPGRVKTEMTKYVQSQVKFKSECPTASTYVESALMTLGNSKRSCGWWFHSAQLILFFENMSEFVADILMPKIMEKSSKDFLAEKAKMEKKQLKCNI